MKGQYLRGETGSLVRIFKGLYGQQAFSLPDSVVTKLAVTSSVTLPESNLRDGWKPLADLDNLIQMNQKGEIRYSSLFNPLVADLGVRLVGVRHGKTMSNSFGILTGQSDDEKLDLLDQEGKLSALSVRDRLIHDYEHDLIKGNVVVITSGARRAQQTADPFIQEVERRFGGVDVVVDPLLMEIGCGEATHRLYADPPQELRSKMELLGINMSLMDPEQESIFGLTMVLAMRVLRLRVRLNTKERIILIC
jgi:hypothetical protein